MTARQLYEAAIIELNKEQAPSLLLEGFNYYANKAVNQYINKRYSTGYDVNQQFTDDVRVLKASTVLYAEPTVLPNNDVTSLQAYLNDAKYVFNLPEDYLHLLNCSCVYKVNKRFKCYDAGTFWEVGATRLTADIAPVILNNWYMRPSYKKPYYYINNRNIDTGGWDEDQELTPTNPIELVNFVKNAGETTYQPNNSISGVLGNNGTDRMLVDVDATHGGPEETYKEYRRYTIDNGTKKYYKQDGTTLTTDVAQAGIWTTPGETATVHSEIITATIAQQYRAGSDSDEFIDLKNQNFPRFRKDRNHILDDTVERTAGNRYGNASKVRIEIRYGRDNSVFELAAIKVDYIKAPQHIRLTQEQIDLTEDTSQILEFPDYVCQEIINELVKLIMENAGDPRLQTQPLVSQSIASPAQEQTPKKK